MEHICDLCLISCKTLGDFNAHKTLHTRENINICYKCDENISRSETLTTHIMTKHKEGTFFCSQCRKTFTGPNCLKTHNITNNDLNQFSCSNCGNIFLQYRDLKRQQKTHSGVKSFVCLQTKCKKSLSVFDDLQPKKQCLKNGYNLCECDKALSKTSNLTAHTKTFSDTNFFSCPKCYKTIPNSSYIPKSMKSSNGEKLKQVKDVSSAIQAHEVGIEMLPLDTGKTNLEENFIKFYEEGLFFTISFSNSDFIQGLLSVLDPEKSFQMRRTNMIFLELGAPNTHGLYKAGLLHLIFGNAGPDGKVIKGKPGKLKDTMGNEQSIGHGGDFQKYFGIDYNAPGSWEQIADCIRTIMTTWSVYGYNQNGLEDKRTGLNLGFTTKLNNEDLFASVIIGSNGFIVTVHINDTPNKRLTAHQTN